jgi:hypothetical protein
MGKKSKCILDSKGASAYFFIEMGNLPLTILKVRGQKQSSHTTVLRRESSLSSDTVVNEIKTVQQGTRASQNRCDISQCTPPHVTLPLGMNGGQSFPWC